MDSCRDCRGRSFAFDAARQAVEFEGEIREAVHRFKYSGCASFAEALGKLIVEIAPDAGGPAVLTWVPPSNARVRQTGMDHGKRLVEWVGGTLGIPSLPLLKRVRETVPQIQLDPARRRRNLKGAFEAEADVAESVALIDDVFTTGATAAEAARALKKGGARRVTVLCVARAMPPES